MFSSMRLQPATEMRIMIGDPIANPLPWAEREAKKINAIRGRDELADTLPSGDLSDLLRMLSKAQYLKVLHLIMHGDAEWHNSDGSIEYTLGLVGLHGKVVTVSPALIVRTIAAANQLELVFINACMSVALGKALFAAGVRRVICWETLVNDKVAMAFSTDFYDAAKKGMTYTYEDAFNYAWRKNAANLCRLDCRLKRVNGVPGVLVNVPRMVVSSQ
jgi:CHAT domain-containing protein